MDCFTSFTMTAFCHYEPERSEGVAIHFGFQAPRTTAHDKYLIS